MTAYRSDFLKTAAERGFIHQCTDEEALDALLSQSKPFVAYIGFDCTAPSLHAGSLVSIMLLRWLQKTGHKPIVLMGGGTSKIGDPSGKDESRKFLGDDDIARNMDGIKKVFSRFLSFGNGPTDAVMVNNADWLDGLEYVSFLREYGRHFTVNRMMTFDSVKLRLEREQPLTFLEFNYMILQAYDFYELYHRHSCGLQMGGSDQWGNIINGVELIRRAASPEPDYGSEGGLPGHAFGLTTPLLTTASGAKMGKTAAGAVWLNADMLSAYDYWQYWRNTEDADVGKFLRLFTDLAIDEIARLEKSEGADINEAKKILAFEVTKLCHGEKAALEAAETARKTFEEGTTAEGLPTIDVARADLEKGIAAFDLFRRSGLAASGGEARRTIKGGGGRINDQSISDETHSVTTDDLNEDGVIKLSAGRKRHALIRAV